MAHALYKAITLPSKCKSSLECRRLLAADAADPVESLCVRHLRALTESSCCKYFCSEMVGRVADHAVQIFGGAGYIADYGIERFYRDVRIFRLYEGTSQIQQLIIARNMLRELTD